MTTTDLVGTWKLVSITIEQDGKKTDFYGPNPQGQVIYEANGRVSNIITRSGLPKFASDSRQLGTPEENAEVVEGSIAMPSFDFKQFPLKLAQLVPVLETPSLNAGSPKQVKLPRVSFDRSNLSCRHRRQLGLTFKNDFCGEVFGSRPKTSGTTITTILINEDRITGFHFSPFCRGHMPNHHQRTIPPDGRDRLVGSRSMGILFKVIIQEGTDTLEEVFSLVMPNHSTRCRLLRTFDVPREPSQSYVT
jgi:Lipocalin-like domain